jgi:hypothetical protein
MVQVDNKPQTFFQYNIKLQNQINTEIVLKAPLLLPSGDLKFY